MTELHNNYLNVATLCARYGVNLDTISGLVDRRNQNGWHKFTIKRGRFNFVDEAAFIKWVFSGKKHARSKDRIFQNTVNTLKAAIMKYKGTAPVDSAMPPIRIEMHPSTLCNLDQEKRRLEARIREIEKEEAKAQLETEFFKLKKIIMDCPYTTSGKIDVIQVLADIAKDECDRGIAKTAIRPVSEIQGC